MSRAFVKEDDGEGGDALPDRPISEHPNFVTAEGLALIDEEIARAAAELTQPATIAPRARKIERDLRYWRARRASAEVIPPPEGNAVVHFGATVAIERDDGRRQTYRIVGEDEADPAAGTLSYVSPLARASIGKAVGDVVTVAGHEAEIAEIR